MRTRTSFQKRQKEIARAEKQRDKIAKRQQKKLMPKPQASAIAEEGSVLVPRFPPDLRLPRGRKPARVELPRVASEPFLVANRGVEWTIRPMGTHPVAAQSSGDAVVYPGAFDGAVAVLGAHAING